MELVSCFMWVLRIKLRFCSWTASKHFTLNPRDILLNVSSYSVFHLAVYQEFTFVSKTICIKLRKITWKSVLIMTVLCKSAFSDNIERHKVDNR